MKSTFPKCTKISLESGDMPTRFLSIAPTMNKIVHEGRTYFRNNRACAQDSTDGQWGMTYLWDGYRKWLLAKLEKEERDLADGSVSK
jgi:hypothetical protein